MREISIRGLVGRQFAWAFCDATADTLSAQEAHRPDSGGVSKYRDIRCNGSAERVREPTPDLGLSWRGNGARVHLERCELCENPNCRAPCLGIGWGGADRQLMETADAEAFPTDARCTLSNH